MNAAGLNLKRCSLVILAALVTAAMQGCMLIWSEQRMDLAQRQEVLETALGQIGRPYRYGGGDGDGFDCSGLVRYVFEEVGVQLPRTAAAQFRSGRSVSLQAALPGDLVFFRIDGGMHVGIYVGDGRVVHAPSAGKDVRVSSVQTPYWQRRYAGTVQVLP